MRYAPLSYRTWLTLITVIQQTTRLSPHGSNVHRPGPSGIYVCYNTCTNTRINAASTPSSAEPTPPPGRDAGRFKHPLEYLVLRSYLSVHGADNWEAVHSPHRQYYFTIFSSFTASSVSREASLHQLRLIYPFH